ncbi:MAG TPA: hypothetical protein VFJ65_10500 [Solirubrobacterales bacterium]|nr:hypothetical protein [Solirubrobacterales bacterium]
MRWRRIGPTALAVGALLWLATAAWAESVQEGTLRVSITTQIKPYKLPRTDPAPIKVFIAGHIASTTGGVPPQLRRMTVLINRHGYLDPHGLPSCTTSQLRPATTKQALRRCGGALVGSGHFWASVVLPDQGAYRTTGRLLAFNGTSQGRPALLAQIYTAQPFPSSFVVPFALRKVSRGPYGTELSASLPQALGSWGFVDRIKMTLGKIYRADGRLHTYLRASCPAPKHTNTTAFSLALASFYFAGGQQLQASVPKSCAVRK